MNHKKAVLIIALVLIAITTVSAGIAIELEASPYAYQGLLTFKNKEYDGYYNSKYGVGYRLLADYRFDNNLIVGFSNDGMFCNYNEFNEGTYIIFSIKAVAGFRMPLTERFDMFFIVGGGVDFRTLNEQNSQTPCGSFNFDVEYKLSDHIALSAGFMVHGSYEVGRGKTSIDPAAEVLLGLTFIP